MANDGTTNNATVDDGTTNNATVDDGTTNNATVDDVNQILLKYCQQGMIGVGLESDQSSFASSWEHLLVENEEK